MKNYIFSTKVIAIIFLLVIILAHHSIFLSTEVYIQTFIPIRKKNGMHNCAYELRGFKVAKIHPRISLNFRLKISA